MGPSVTVSLLVAQVGIVCLERSVVLPFLRVGERLLLILVGGLCVPVVEHVDVVLMLPEFFGSVSKGVRVSSCEFLSEVQDG